MIKKNLIVTVFDSVDLASGIETDALNLRTTAGGQVILEAYANKLAVKLEDLQEAMDAIKEFQYHDTNVVSIVSKQYSEAELMDIDYDNPDLDDAINEGASV